MNLVVDHVRYHVDTWGNGYPLIVLHGFTGDGASWRAFEQCWENSSVIAVDIIGHSKTDAPRSLDDYGMERAAKVIHSLMKQMNIEKADILGYSMGGRLALTVAVKYPDKVRNLILESSSPGLECEQDRAKRREQDYKLGEFIKKNGVSRFVDYWEEIPLFASQKRLAPDIQEKLRQQRLMNDPTGLINSLNGMGTGAQPSWWDDLQLIESPVLLITGSLDEKFCRIAKQMSEKLTQCEWISVENVGHAIHVEKPEIFGTIVSKYLSDAHK